MSGASVCPHSRLTHEESTKLLERDRWDSDGIFLGIVAVLIAALSQSWSRR